MYFLIEIDNEGVECSLSFSGVNMEPHKKQLHISLAYQFPPENRDKLEALAKCINLDAPVRWDLRLYSRDPRVANCQVVIF